MQSFIAALNGLANRLFDAGLSLPGVLGPAAEMAAVALLLGVVTAAVFHRFADRSALRESRRALGAGLLEIWLYRHDPGLVLRAEGRLLRANLRYLRGLLPPLALSAALAAPVLIQSWHRFGLEPAAPGSAGPADGGARPRGGRPGVAGACVGSRAGERSPPSSGSPPWTGSSGAFARGRPGIHSLGLAGANGSESFPLLAGAAPGSITASRESSPWRLLIHPRGPPLPAESGLRRVWVEYPRSGVERLIWPAALSLLAAFVTYRLMDRRLSRRP